VPQELRKIVFNNEELMSAAYDYCLRTDVRIPQVPIDEIIIGEADNAVLTLKFATVDASDQKEFALSRDQVGAALIKYCSANNIPMARMAKKILKVDKGEISLMVSIQWPTKP